jgi:heavy metal sensor kinase
MRSIRLSLVVYFLVLLGISLGAVSLLVYQTTRDTLLEKTRATRDLLKAQYDNNGHDVRMKLENDLLTCANSLAGLAGLQMQLPRAGLQRYFSLGGMIASSASPNAHITEAVWLAQGLRGPQLSLLERMLITEIQFSEEEEDELPHVGDGRLREYFQISTEFGKVWRSPSLEQQGIAFDPGTFATIALNAPKYEDLELTPGLKVCRVGVKTHASWIRREFNVTRRPGTERRGPPPPRGGRPPFPTGPFVDRPQEIFVQCACDTSQRDADLAQLRSDLDADLANLEDESQVTLASLQRRLWWISLLTFAATVVGGFWLVRLGLSPLSRLSDAVSRVSEKDFRLQFEEPHTPQELRPIVERLTQTLDQLKRAFAREKQAAADISHDLRTPLAALLTTTEVALRKPRSPEEYREVIEECRASGQQMSHLVERLLALARLDAGVDTLRPRDVDVTNLTEQCAAMVRPLAEARGLSLRVHGNGPLRVNVDPDKLREVLNNLLSNAIEYNRPQGCVEVHLQRDNGHLKLEVRDTGIGVPAEAREHIFERFYRVDPARDTEGLHCGLGLAIVKGYVDLMGGTIRVESEETRGSTFAVQLPVSA